MSCSLTPSRCCCLQDRVASWVFSQYAGSAVVPTAALLEFLRHELQVGPLCSQLLLSEGLLAALVRTLRSRFLSGKTVESALLQALAGSGGPLYLLAAELGRRLLAHTPMRTSTPVN